MNGFDYYRIKTSWTGEKEDGGLTKKKTEELVYASCYSEAEKVAYALIEDQQRAKFSDDVAVEIIKTKIDELLYNDNLVKDDNLINGLVCNYFQESEETGIGLYAVKVMFIEIDEKTAKEKRTHEVIYTPAASNTDATKKVSEYLKSSMRDFVVRDTKFDKAEAILWPKNFYKQKIDSYNAA